MTEGVSLSQANPANTADELASLAVLAEPPPATRDQQGRFLTGNSGGGRPKGARNRLTEVVLAAISNDFVEHGADAIARVRMADPVSYLKIVGALLPPELVLKQESQPSIDYADLTFEEAGALADEERKRQIIRRAIEGI